MASVREAASEIASVREAVLDPKVGLGAMEDTPKAHGVDKKKAAMYSKDTVAGVGTGATRGPNVRRKDGQMD